MRSVATDREQGPTGCRSGTKQRPGEVRQEARCPENEPVPLKKGFVFGRIPFSCPGGIGLDRRLFRVSPKDGFVTESIHMKSADRLQSFLSSPGLPGILILVFLLPLLPLAGDSSAGAAEGDSILWMTSDLEGYLSGCECPTGFSAGISAVLPALAERNRLSEPLVDLGGYREPSRSDSLLEGYLDQAAQLLGYSAMIAVSSDLRDGNRAFRQRARALPISLAASVSDRRFFRNPAGEGQVVVLEAGSRQLALASMFGAGESARIGESGNGNLESTTSGEILAVLDAADADFRILVFRGGIDEFSEGLEEMDSGSPMPDMLVLTGQDSPAYGLATGGLQGQMTTADGDLPWFSLSPRGNALGRLTISAGGSVNVAIRELERGISPEDESLLTMAAAYVDDLVDAALKAAGRTRSPLSAETESAVLDADYWFPFGCRDCEDFLWNTVPELERTSGRNIEIHEWNTSDPDSFEALMSELERRETTLRFIPVMIVGDDILQGDDEIKNGLEALAFNQTASGFGESGRQVRWEPGAVFLAGLLDGVNPCAFSAMVFLISALALAGRSKQTMLAIGLFYAFGVFLSYGLIGAGLLGGLKSVVVDSGLRNVLEYSLAAFLIVLAALSAMDGWKLSRGRNDLTLKLPEKLSRRVHLIIRDSVRSGAAAGGSFLLGVVVALIELGCTGQVYLPTIAWMIARNSGAAPWLWLIIYNTAFIIPLLIVFVVSYRGVTAVRLAAAFRRRGALVKYSTAGLFVLLALFVLLT